MDPLTHIVIGRAVVAAARDERRNRAVGAAAILGALAPDVDSLLAFSGWDRYVRAHQYGTHSLAGALALAVLAAAIVAAISRLYWRRRSGHFTIPFRTLVAAAAAGALSHIALDLISGARIGVAWPLADGRVSAPLVSMADPWLVGVCLVWLLMLWPVRVELRRASRVAVAATVIFLAVKGVLLGVAVRRSGITPAPTSAIEARWGSLTDWVVFERIGNAVRASEIGSNRGVPDVVMAEPLPPPSPLIAASRALEDVRNFLAVHEFAFADEHGDDDGSRSVMWSDLRYCRPAAAGVVWRAATQCGVHVGGVFDSRGRAITQEIRIGAIVQRRPPA